MSVAATPTWYSCAHGWVGVNVLLACTTFKVIFAYAIELSSIYYSKITVIHDISEQIKQRVHIGTVFARWHLAMAITCKYFEYTFINVKWTCVWCVIENRTVLSAVRWGSEWGDLHVGTSSEDNIFFVNLWSIIKVIIFFFISASISSYVSQGAGASPLETALLESAKKTAYSTFFSIEYCTVS